MENSFEATRKLKQARKRVESIKGFYKHLAAYLLVNVFLLLMKAINLEPGEDFWHWSTFVTAVSWGIGLLAHGLAVFGRNIFFAKDWEERKIQEFMEREKNKTNKWE